jgi:CheY-like chemotaxis protein
MRPRERKSIEEPAESGRVGEGEPTVQRLRERIGVLVVDDEHLVRIMVQLGLQRNGFDVWLAPNGREAIELYRTHRDSIGVVLLDVRMPGLDGPATLDALRRLNPDVLACFMCGDLGDHEPAALQHSGAAHVINKPFLLNELANTLRLLAHGVPADLLTSAGDPGSEIR